MNIEKLQKIYNLKKTLKTTSEKNELSKYEEYIPMFDIYSYSIYLIHKNNVHEKLTKYNFRFINDNVFDWLKSIEENLIKKENLIDEKKEILKKIQNGIAFLKNYNIKILQETSSNILYEYSLKLDLGITICKRNSFIPFFQHLKPYYSHDEIINLGLNMGIKLKVNKEQLLEPSILYDTCKLVSKNDVSSKIIFEHTKYIMNTDSSYLVKYYSLYGSHFLNRMLRNTFNQKNHNETYPESLIDVVNKLSKTIHNSPCLDKSYYVYRFVTNDDYLKHLKIGDTFMDPGFMSATRDPFYGAGSEQIFGMILIKIHIPENVNGIGLFIENFSHFPKEQEILFAPFTKFKLLSIDDNFKYYHINKSFEKKIQKKYEFEFVSINNNKITIPISNYEIPVIDFNDLKIEGPTILQRINNFIQRYTNEKGEFSILCENQTLVFYYQWFDSYSPYSQFYQNKTKNGINFVSYNENMQPHIWIELGDNLFINYYNK